jgi:hypothetical protein
VIIGKFDIGTVVSEERQYGDSAKSNKSCTLRDVNLFRPLISSLSTVV